MYQNGKIYAIRSHETDEIYIGSTTQTLSRRMTDHRKFMKRWKDGKCNYTSSFKILEYQTCYIELLENYPCNNKEELFKKEGEYIRKMECVNKRIEGRTPKQHYQDNKDEILERQKQYYLDNIDKIKEQKKQYRHDNKEVIRDKKKQYNLDNKEKISERYKQRYLDNAEKIKDKTKQYYLDNVDKIKERQKQKYTCECGIEYTHSNKARHLKTKLHQAYIATLETN